MSRFNGRTFCFSDVHGCYKELMALYQKIIKEAKFDPKKDRLIGLGDYIDRGPDTRKVIQQLIRWKKKYPHFLFLYGNHCDLMLDVLLYQKRIYHSYDLWWEQGGKETTESYIPKGLPDYEKALVSPKAVIPDEHIKFLATLPRYFEDDKYIYVHGGLVPGIKLEEQHSYNLIWIRDEFIHHPTLLEKKVIFGHTPNRGQHHNSSMLNFSYPTLKPDISSRANSFMPIIYQDKIGIDTAVCAHNGQLTMLELPAEKFYFQGRIK